MYVEPETKVFDISGAEGALERKRILMLEDDAAFRGILKEHLESHGYQVVVAKDGVEGLKHVMASEFDVILCDLLMPHLPGDMFYRAVERTRPHLCRRFLFMTGHKANPKWEAFVRQIRGFILWKPFEMVHLLESIEAVLRKEWRKKT